MPSEADVITRDPLNVETSWEGLASARTPTSEFYTRNNFPIPTIAPRDWKLELRGFARPASLTYDELRALPQKEIEVVLECAGNNRTYFDPKPEGTAWRERAVACATFRGAPLSAALEKAGIPASAVEIVFRGADGGTFERSIPVGVAKASDTLLAWEMNGAPLVAKHGAPVRLLVPGWYGVASVKWIVEARALDKPFVGHFQTERYVYARSKDDRAPVPVREKRVNSIVSSPMPDARVRAGAPLDVRGWAWSGNGPIARVEVSLDGGASWTDAALDADRGIHAWRGWRLATTAPAHPGSEMTILCRAHDLEGHAQPDRPEWNVHGYGYNAPRPRRVRVE